MRGNIRRRAKGSWTIQVYAGNDPTTGRKRYVSRTVHGTKKEAELAMARLVQSIETGLDLDASRLTVAAYMGKWLEVQRQRVRVRTYARYSELVRLHVVPVIGRLQLAKVKPLHVERVYARAFEKGLSAQTVLHVHRVLNTALRQAVRWQLVSRNVAEAVTPPRPGKRDLAALRPEDATRLLEGVAGSDLEMPTVLALGTGMRLGEVLGLRWSEVDFDSGAAAISQTIQETRGVLAFAPPKTHRSERAVSLPDFVVEAFRSHRKAQAERRLMLGEAWQEFGLVIDRGDGAPVRPSSLSARFRTLTRKLGLDLTFHGLRHGHASLMLAAGVHLKVVSERLGHSTIGITADLYTHVAEELHREAAARFDLLIRPPAQQVVSKQEG